jgi:hypothetical protein
MDSSSSYFSSENSNSSLSFDEKLFNEMELVNHIYFCFIVDATNSLQEKWKKVL